MYFIDKNDMKKLRINIASSHRFHLLDLARELSQHGHDVKFYSFVPTKRCIKFGLKKSECRSLLPFVLVLLALGVLFPNSNWIIKYRDKLMDYIVGYTMRKCDVFIALGTVYLESFNMAKKRFGAKTILEWGSKHIDDQQKILSLIGAKLNDEYFNIRSRNAYSLVDYIAVASEHVVRSFLSHGISRDKLLLNPYGVDLSMFYPDTKVKKEYDVIMVGGWGYRKGCDLIVEALKDTNLTFLHVGGLVDMEFPDLPNFTHVPPVDQSKLIEYYNKAKIALLPSREEGLAMVQAQAIACNLPLVGSVDSGAEDLKKMVKHPEYITIIDEYTPEKTREAIESTLQQYQKLGSTIYAGDAVNNLTWQAYGKRYAIYLTQIYISK